MSYEKKRQNAVIVGKGLASIIGVMGLANLTPLAPIAWIASGIYAIWALTPERDPNSQRNDSEPVKASKPRRDLREVEISLPEEQLEEMGIDPNQESINMTEAELKDFLDQARTVRTSDD